MFHLFEEIPWNHFQNLPQIKSLPLNEQVMHYNTYLNNLSAERLNYVNWLQSQGSGVVATGAGSTGDQLFDEAIVPWDEAIGNWDE